MGRGVKEWSGQLEEIKVQAMEEGGENGVGRWMTRGEEERKCEEEMNAFPHNCKARVCGGLLD